MRIENGLHTLTNRRYDANRNFEQLVKKIRNRKGFEDFLLSPTQEKLKAAATRGPIDEKMIGPLHWVP
jgi:hypothetical protein